VAAAFLLTCFIFLIKGKDRLAFLFAGLAIMTKQHTLFAVGMMVIVCKQYMNWRRLLTNCAITAGVVAAISLPFMVTGNFTPISILFYWRDREPAIHPRCVLHSAAWGPG